MPPSVRTAALVLALSAAAVGEVAAQAILVRVTAEATGQPLQGALVSVTSGPSGTRATALSDAAGRARFVDLAPGAYAVRAELIGHATATRAGVAAGPGEATVVELRLASRAIELEGLSVDGEERCRVRPEEGLRVAAVWDEARKALEAARLTARENVYQYRTREYTQDLEESGRVVDQSTRRSVAYLATPYRSLPAEELVADGFVQEVDDEAGGTMYYAPDADVLLSDVFLDSHCFRLRRGENEDAGRVGLAFQPVRGRDVPDISGTFWIDAGTSELVRLDYAYVNLDPDVTFRDVGGEVRFQRLPDGSWIVPEWSIRMPRLARARDFQGRPIVRQAGLRVAGGTVLTVREPGGGTVLTASTATLEGVVLEEISSEPVEGARVHLAGTDEAAVTGADGRFRFVELVPGRYDVSFDHPAMAPYGLEPETEVVEATAGTVSSVQLRMPSQLSLVGRACADELDTRPPGTSVLVGRVLDRGTGMPLSGAEVTIRWTDFDLRIYPGAAGTTRGDRASGDLVGIRAAGDGLVATTGADGTYRACVVPENTRLDLEARWGPFEATPDTARIPVDAPALGHDLYVGVAARTTVVGLVREWSSERPVADAEVRLRPVDAAEGSRATVAVADAEGRFVAEDASPGRWIVEAGSLGYATVTDTVEVRDGRINHVTVRLPEAALEVEGLTVEVEARVERLDATGFYQRQRAGSGVFIDQDQVESRVALRASDLLMNRPGIQVLDAPGQRGGGRQILSGGRGCPIAIYVDGARVFGDLDDVVRPNDIAGLEVFRSPAELPTEYTGTGSQCGVLLVWTR